MVTVTGDVVWIGNPIYWPLAFVTATVSLSYTNSIHEVFSVRSLIVAG
jgi:hypothetical protein